MKSFCLLILLVCTALSVDAASGKKKESLEEISRDAYVWGYPAVLMSKVREALFEQLPQKNHSMNQFFQSHKVADPLFSQILSIHPENFYGWAWLDLSTEPLIMTYTQKTDDFYSFQFVDSYSNVFKTVSNRHDGKKTGTFILTAPGWSGELPANTSQIRVSTPEVFFFAESFAQAPSIQLIPLSIWKKTLQKDLKNLSPAQALRINKNLAADGLDFYRRLIPIIAKNPPFTEAEAQEMERFKILGLQSNASFEAFSGDPEIEKALVRGLFEGERLIQNRKAKGFGAKVNAWSYEMKSPAYTEDFPLRAAIAQGFLFSTPPEEIMQMTLEVDSESRQLTGSYSYLLHFEKENLPPAQSMWSASVYEMSGKNKDVTVSHLNDQTANLKYNTDGSLAILLQSKKPAAPRANWLAAPKDANFYVVLTFFNPRNSALNRKYIAPSLLRLDENNLPKLRVTQKMMAKAQEPVSE